MKKLKFDKEQLKFIEDIPRFWDYLKKFLWFLVASVGLALVYYVVFALFFNSEEDKRMIQETKAIESEYYKLEDKMDRLDNVISNLQARDRAIYRDIFNSDPPYFISDFEDTIYSFQGDTTNGSALVRYTALRIDNLQRGIDALGNTVNEINGSLNNNIADMRAIPSIIPVADFSIVQTGATVGRKMHPFYKTIVTHTGLDLITSVGTEVYASANGKVSDIKKSEKGKGNMVIIDHGNGYVTTYSHLGDIMVRKGQKIKQGKTIGRVGTSGTTFAPHLHYEVLLRGEYKDPINYFFADLTPSLYKEMMMIAINTGQSLD